jgi:predicted Rossmann fold flavoprotein
LLGAFHRFGPGDMMQWLEESGVPLKYEADGRVFPVSDDSSSIIQCFKYQLNKHNVVIRNETMIKRISQDSEGRWGVEADSKPEVFDRLLIATGGSEAVWDMLYQLGLSIIPPVPSLFTFNIADQRIQGLQGLSVPKAVIQIKETKQTATGPLLITHWGMSGPAVLRLSAAAARELAEMRYRFSITINFTGIDKATVLEALHSYKSSSPKKVILPTNMFNIPLRLWQSLCIAAGITEQLRWGDISNKMITALHVQLADNSFIINGKSTFKDEFVTAGGVSLKEVDFRTMQARRFPGLYFAGEVLNIDGVTGGFNFQSAWTTAWIAAHHIADIT